MNLDFSAYAGTNLNWTALFAAMNVDPATGLYYANARWYNPSLGVFATKTGFADPNTYRYAGNNPVTATDPSGEVIPRNYVWDPNVNDFVDTFSGQTRTRIRGTEAANFAAFQATVAANRSWVNDYSGWFNANMPGGQAVSGKLGGGIYSLKSSLGMSNAAIANESNAALATEAIVGGIVGGLALFFGGEAVLGVGTAGNWSAAG